MVPVFTAANCFCCRAPDREKVSRRPTQCWTLPACRQVSQVIQFVHIPVVSCLYCLVILIIPSQWSLTKAGWTFEPGRTGWPVSGAGLAWWAGGPGHSAPQLSSPAALLDPLSSPGQPGRHTEQVTFKLFHFIDAKQVCARCNGMFSFWFNIRS